MPPIAGGALVSVARFESSEPPLEFPLLPRPLARLKKRGACGRVLIRAQRVSRTLWHGMIVPVPFPPQTRSR
jgi:hypothetical protein